MMVRGRGAGFLAVVLLLAACEGSTDPGFVDLELEPLAPLPAYESWWEDTAACSGLKGAFDQVSFYRVKAPLVDGGASFPCGENGEPTLCSGLWQAPHDIYLAPAMLRVQPLVRHEMLHDLIGASGHPPVFEECDLLAPFTSVSSRHVE